MIFHNRGYLPHIEAPEGIYFVTFRLAGSLPSNLLEAWRSERQEIISNAQRQKRSLSDHEQERLRYLYLDRVEKYLDLGRGDCWLSKPQLAGLVVRALKYFDRTRYMLLPGA